MLAMQLLLRILRLREPVETCEMRAYNFTWTPLPKTPLIDDMLVTPACHGLPAA